MKPETGRRLSKFLVIFWFALVSIALALVLMVALIPNELRDHMPVWPYGVPFVVLVAALGLPLLVAAVLLDRRVRREVR